MCKVQKEDGADERASAGHHASGYEVEQEVHCKERKELGSRDVMGPGEIAPGQKEECHFW